MFKNHLGLIYILGLEYGNPIYKSVNIPTHITHILFYNLPNIMVVVEVGAHERSSNQNHTTLLARGFNVQYNSPKTDNSFPL